MNSLLSVGLQQTDIFQRYCLFVAARSVLKRVSIPQAFPKLLMRPERDVLDPFIVIWPLEPVTYIPFD